MNFYCYFQIFETATSDIGIDAFNASLTCCWQHSRSLLHMQAHNWSAVSKRLLKHPLHTLLTECSVARCIIHGAKTLSDLSSRAMLLSLSVSALIHLHFNQYKLRRKKDEWREGLGRGMRGCTLEPLSPPWPGRVEYRARGKSRQRKKMHLSAAGFVRKSPRRLVQFAPILYVSERCTES